MIPATRSKIWLPAAAIGLVVAALIALAGYFLLQAGLRHSTPILQEATRTGAAAVGEAVAGQFARALELGIPLDKLVGVDAYLRRIADGSPQVGGLALLDGDGRIVAATAPDVSGETFEIAAGGARASLVVEAVSPLFEDAMRRIWISLSLAALLAGVISAALTAGYLRLSWQPSRERLLRAVDRAGEGDFTEVAVFETSGPFFAASQALAGCVEQVEAARRKLAEAVATIHAIDFDGSLGRRVDTILQPLEGRYVLPDRGGDETQRAEGPAPAGGLIWRAAVVAGLSAAAFPFVGNFAIDRGTTSLSAAWVGVVPLLAELLLFVLGVLAGRVAAGRGGAVRALALILLGLSTGAVFWCRDYGLFVVLRGGAGFAAGLALAALLGHGRARPRVLTLALLFAALVVAPLFAGLLAEAIGRRASFLALGGLVLALCPFLVGMGGDRAEERPKAGAPWFDPATALAMVPVSAFVFVLIPLGIGYNNYLVGAGAVAMLGVAALATPRLPRLAIGAALGAAALLLHYAPGGDVVSAYAAGAALGVALGGALANAAGQPRAVSAALAAGAAVGLLLAGGAGQFGFSPSLAIAAAALLSMALPLVTRSRLAPAGV
ncbi:hypothetical protein [Jiella pelagia]|nr:hypothetical protein [Jiella pelagia]